MRPISLSVVAVLVASAAAHADPHKLTLAQVMDRATANLKVQMAVGDRDAAEARVHEADASRLPRIKATAFGTLSPKIICLDKDCLQTDPKNFALRFSGFYGSGLLELTQPLYTFGKIQHAREAARAGLDAQRALADEAAGDAAVDAARAYWGLRLARELHGMLDDGIDEIDKALVNMKAENEGKDLSIQDRQRIAVLVATAKTQRADAVQAETQALAGLRALIGSADADIDAAELAPVARELPTEVDVGGRPQTRAAKAGAVASDALIRSAKSAYFPDFAFVATAGIAGAQGVDDPPSTFANDPYNRSGFGAVIGLQWTFEPGTTSARVARARADSRKAHAQAELAALGATFDGRQALAEAVGAKERLTASSEGEQAARTWLASVLQAEALGIAEARDFADAYIAWFQMRALYTTAVFQWNVAVVRLDRAAGKFAAH